MSTNLISKVGALGNQANFATDANGNPIGLVNPAGGLLNINDVKSRFLNSLAGAKSFQQGNFLLAIPAWTVGVLVNEGFICQNGGNAYQAISAFNNNNGRVSTTPPTGTGTGIIVLVDGVSWLYLGAADTPMADQQDTPTITVSTVPASCTKVISTAISNGAGDYVDTVALQNFYISGAFPVWASGSGGGVNGITAGTPPIANTVYNGMSVEFMTDSPIVAVNHLQNGAGIPYTVQGFINGNQISTRTGTSVPFTAGTNNNQFSYIFDWATKGNRIRRVKVPVGTYNAGIFTQVAIPPQYSIWAPYNPNRYRLATEGDSIWQGGSPGNGGLRASMRLGAYLGCDDVWDTSIGSTGFINMGTTTNLIGRIQNIINIAPDILWINCINNDVGNDATYNSTTRKAAYTLYFSTLLAALPNIIIICGGGYATGANNLTTTVSSAWQVEQDMQTAINEYNHTHVKFLPMMSDPTGRWLFGNGMVSTTSNSVHGNSDLFIGDSSDTLHPNPRYYEVMTRRIGNGIISIMNNIS